MVVEVLHPHDPRADTALEEIAGEYERRFRQDAVLHVRAAAEARFFE